MAEKDPFQRLLGDLQIQQKPKPEAPGASEPVDPLAQLIEDPKEAEVVARAEKPIRDAVRLAGVSPKLRESGEQLAKIAGDVAQREYQEQATGNPRTIILEGLKKAIGSSEEVLRIKIGAIENKIDARLDSALESLRSIPNSSLAILGEYGFDRNTPTRVLLENPEFITAFLRNQRFASISIPIFESSGNPIRRQQEALLSKLGVLSQEGIQSLEDLKKKYLEDEKRDGNAQLKGLFNEFEAGYAYGSGDGVSELCAETGIPNLYVSFNVDSHIGDINLVIHPEAIRRMLIDKLENA